MKEQIKRCMAVCIGLVALAAPLFAAGPVSAVSTAVPKTFSESPALAAQVKAGKLPALKDRLPSEPLVQAGVEGNGSYAVGPLKVVSNENAKIGDGRNAVSVASFVLVDYDGATLRPNLIKAWKYSPDFKELTLTLRKGVKWSDGVEFTTEDIRFWWDDVMNNTDLNKSVATQWLTKSGPMAVKVIDKYTVKFVCGDPYPNLIVKTIEYSGYQNHGTYYPSHYARQFHKNYADPAKLDAMMKEKGFTDWVQLFNAKNVAYWDPQSAETIGEPTLNAYMVTGVGPNFIELERNPYYWKVDPAGKQLPYIDKMYVQVVSSAEIYHAKIASGEADFAARRTKVSEMAVYKNGEKAGNYRTRIWQSVGDGDYVLLMNFNNKDKKKQELVQNLDFRKAVSQAIDRNEFNQNRSFGLGTPSQIPLPVTSRFMEPAYRDAYVKLNLAEANKLLDKLGLKWDAAKEYRTFKDGSRLSFDMINGGERPFEGDELLTAHLKKVGIEIKPQLLARDLYSSRLDSGDFDMHMRKYGMLDVAFADRPDMALPIEAAGVDVWAPAWANWRVAQLSGVSQSSFQEKPPANVVKLIEEWNKMKSLQADSKEYVDIGKALIKAQAENLWTIGIITGGPQPVIVSNRLGNVLEKGIYTYDYLLYAQYARADSWYLK